MTNISSYTVVMSGKNAGKSTPFYLHIYHIVHLRFPAFSSDITMGNRRKQIIGGKKFGSD